MVSERERERKCEVGDEKLVECYEYLSSSMAAKVLNYLNASITANLQKWAFISLEKKYKRKEGKDKFSWLGMLLLLRILGGCQGWIFEVYYVERFYLRLIIVFWTIFFYSHPLTPPCLPTSENYTHESVIWPKNFIYV